MPGQIGRAFGSTFCTADRGTACRNCWHPRQFGETSASVSHRGRRAQSHRPTGRGSRRTHQRGTIRRQPIMQGCTQQAHDGKPTTRHSHNIGGHFAHHRTVKQNEFFEFVIVDMIDLPFRLFVGLLADLVGDTRPDEARLRRRPDRRQQSGACDLPVRPRDDCAQQASSGDEV